MPNNKQAAKRVRQDADRKGRNKIVRTSMRTAIKKVLAAETPEDAQKNLPRAMKMVDKAAKNNVIHAKAAARKKSQLSRKANG